MDESGKDLREEMRKLLNARWKVGLSDGRTIIGRLTCIDQHRNLILVDTVEFRPKEDESGSRSGGRRKLGMALVPGKHIVHCAYDETSLGKEQTIENLLPEWNALAVNGVAAGSVR